MLYDPKWEKNSETKADPFTLESLIAWLEKQPATRRYCYESNGHCLLAQYFSAHGYKDVSMGPHDFDHEVAGARCYVDLPRVFNNVANDDDMTFGGALERARTALADRS